MRLISDDGATAATRGDTGAPSATTPGTAKRSAAASDAPVASDASDAPVASDASDAPAASGAPADAADSVSAMASADEAAGRTAAPWPNYDELSLASLRARLRSLDLAQVRQLTEYERAHAGRSDVIAMFERRIVKLEAEAKPAAEAEPEAGA